MDCLPHDAVRPLILAVGVVGGGGRQSGCDRGWWRRLAIAVGHEQRGVFVERRVANRRRRVDDEDSGGRCVGRCVAHGKELEILGRLVLRVRHLVAVHHDRTHAGSGAGRIAPEIARLIESRVLAGRTTHAGRANQTSSAVHVPMTVAVTSRRRTPLTITMCACDHATRIV